MLTTVSHGVAIDYSRYTDETGSWVEVRESWVVDADAMECETESKIVQAWLDSEACK